ncbi:hypothetical protein JOC34_004144 [Virgibacillus halotolerans]|uniref:hypothetical protein n=1 Tax=Virgibacillus halotolerans TaxID=1071053 RepID=UPI0019618BF3|nr:hypothetical protein [Virgibacillus halotolerans]MBM7601715.1 hypothetical protein [Virgibacillus halotolerans]
MTSVINNFHEYIILKADKVKLHSEGVFFSSTECLFVENHTWVSKTLPLRSGHFSLYSLLAELGACAGSFLYLTLQLSYTFEEGFYCSHQTA